MINDYRTDDTTCDLRSSCTETQRDDIMCSVVLLRLGRESCTVPLSESGWGTAGTADGKSRGVRWGYAAGLMTLNEISMGWVRGTRKFISDISRWYLLLFRGGRYTTRVTRMTSLLTSRENRYAELHGHNGTCLWTYVRSRVTAFTLSTPYANVCKWAGCF